MSETEEEISQFKEELKKVLEKSQDTFETQLSYISAGALALSMAFIKDIVKFNEAVHKWLIILGWSFLALTLLINFISHNLSADASIKTIDEINNQKYDAKKIQKRFLVISIINWITVGTLVLGITSVIIYASINIKP